MDTKDLRKLLEESDNKLHILTDMDILSKYSPSEEEMCRLISDFLSDEEKLELFDCELYAKFSVGAKTRILHGISEDSKKSELIMKDGFSEGLDSSQIFELAERLGNIEKINLLQDDKFAEKCELSAETRKRLSSKYRDNMIFDLYVDGNDESRMKALIGCKGLSRAEKMILIDALSLDGLCDFIKNNTELLHSSGIHPYEIMLQFDSEKQLGIIEQLEGLNLSLPEQREIMATLKPETKEKIDIGDMPYEYKTALSMKISPDKKIVLDLDRDLEDYRGLDILLEINPEKFEEEDRARLKQLCSICPDLQVVNDLDEDIKCCSTGSEYLEAEEWIDSVISSIKPEYSDLQKIAIIDNAIGKKISYSFDFETEVFDRVDARALWKIISSEKGVCNGISRIEQYMLDRVGIQSEIVQSKNHSFLKLSDIELPSENGEVVRGNTILDPTWDLFAQKFNGIPCNFLISYEEARRNDIDENGVDSKSHKNDEKLSDATLSLDIQNLRELYTSVGLAKDNVFPIRELVLKSRAIHENFASQPDVNIRNQLDLFSQFYPDFAKCPNESTKLLSDLMLDSEHLKFDRCVINRVYDKSDSEKNPVLYVYVDSKELGRKFYVAGKDARQFAELSQEEFVQQFECYDMDLQKNNGIRPWEAAIHNRNNENISKTSEKTVTEEGDER